jgi:hypothetical protein
MNLPAELHHPRARVVRQVDDLGGHLLNSAGIARLSWYKRRVQSVLPRMVGFT